MKINITVNSELFSLNEPQSLASFMKTWGREGPHAVAINNAINASQAQVVTVSVRRQDPKQKGGQDFWSLISSLNLNILPNTAGCHSVKEAVTTAQMTSKSLCSRGLKCSHTVPTTWFCVRN